MADLINSTKGKQSDKKCLLVYVSFGLQFSASHWQNTLRVVQLLSPICFLPFLLELTLIDFLTSLHRNSSGQDSQGPQLPCPMGVSDAILFDPSAVSVDGVDHSTLLTHFWFGHALPLELLWPHCRAFSRLSDPKHWSVPRLRPWTFPLPLFTDLIQSQGLNNSQRNLQPRFLRQTQNFCLQLKIWRLYLDVQWTSQT